MHVYICVCVSVCVEVFSHSWLSNSVCSTRFTRILRCEMGIGITLFGQWNCICVLEIVIQRYNFRLLNNANAYDEKHGRKIKNAKSEMIYYVSLSLLIDLTQIILRSYLSFRTNTWSTLVI